MSGRSRQYWGLYDLNQPVWLTVVETATASISSTVIVLMFVERLSVNLYSNVSGAIICIGWLASAIFNRRYGWVLFSGALLALNLFSIGSAILTPDTTRIASGPAHDMTSGVSRQP